MQLDIRISFRCTNCAVGIVTNSLFITLALKVGKTQVVPLVCGSYNIGNFVLYHIILVIITKQLTAITLSNRIKSLSLWVKQMQAHAEHIPKVLVICSWSIIMIKRYIISIHMVNTIRINIEHKTVQLCQDRYRCFINVNTSIMHHCTHHHFLVMLILISYSRLSCQKGGCHEYKEDYSTSEPHCNTSHDLNSLKHLQWWFTGSTKHDRDEHAGLSNLVITIRDDCIYSL